MQHNHETSRLLYAANTGFFAGLIWGTIKVIEHSLKFTQVVPGFIVEPFFRHEFLATWFGYAIGLGSFIVFSIIAAWIYAFFCSKLRGPWPGVAYGAAWWGALYLLIGPMIGLVPMIDVLDWNSIVTDLCLFILWGAFIGYTLTFEYTDERERDVPIPVD